MARPPRGGSKQETTAPQAGGQGTEWGWAVCRGGTWGSRGSQGESGRSTLALCPRDQSGPCSCLGCPGTCCPRAFLGWGLLGCGACAPGTALVSSRFPWGKGRVRGGWGRPGVGSVMLGVPPSMCGWVHF